MFRSSFAVGLHISLLLIYLGLIMVWWRESVHSIMFNIQEGNEATTVLSVILNSYYTVRSFYSIFFANFRLPGH